MKKYPILLALAGAATLAACGGTYQAQVGPAPQAGVVVVETTPMLRSGYGRVESITPVTYNNGAVTGYNRLGLRMDDGSWQAVDTRGPRLVIGERVEITPERNIRYPVASR